MSKSPSGIMSSLRRYIAERRLFPRLRAQRRARLLFNVSLPGAGGRLHPIEGHTRDISEGGLALVVRELRIGDNFLTDQGCTLRIVLLDIPSGVVEIHATPVRYEQIEEPEGGHLIGVQITHMSDSDRYRFRQYLNTLPG